MKLSSKTFVVKLKFTPSIIVNLIFYLIDPLVIGTYFNILSLCEQYHSIIFFLPDSENR